MLLQFNSTAFCLERDGSDSHRLSGLLSVNNPQQIG
jgi:hypothetical protein